MTTRLEIVNKVLNNLKLNNIQSTTQPMGKVALDCIDQAITSFCTSGLFNAYRTSTVADSWSDELASLSSKEVYKVSSVATKQGTAKIPSRYITREQFDVQTKYGFTGTSGQVQYWTYSDANVIQCNPYPDDDTAKATVFFDYYYIPSQPTTDFTSYTINERHLKLIVLKASSLLAIKYLPDSQYSTLDSSKLYQVYNREYETLKQRILNGDSGVPQQGYTMYRGNRQRNN
jgi:hypothetical protein